MSSYDYDLYGNAVFSTVFLDSYTVKSFLPRLDRLAGLD